jgi:hypothetical protein
MRVNLYQPVGQFVGEAIVPHHGLELISVGGILYKRIHDTAYEKIDVVVCEAAPGMDVLGKVLQ